MTSVHFLVQWKFALGISSVPRWSQALGGNQIREMSWKNFLVTSLPCGIVTAMDVGFSNLAIARISVTLYTMLKASSPIFVVISAYLFGIEPITSGLILVVLIISAGEFLTVYGESEATFDVMGAIFCILASICSGMRWTVIQFFIQSIDPPLKSAIATMRLVSPCMFIAMLSFAFAIEHPIRTLTGGGSAEVSPFFDSYEHTIRTIFVSLGGGFLAVSMIMCELWLIMKSSAIVLMVGGVVKELCTICLGVLVFHDILNPINVMGFFIVFLGVVLYKLIFHIRKMQEMSDKSTSSLVKENVSDALDLRDEDSKPSHVSYDEHPAFMAEATKLFDGNFSIGDDEDEDDDFMEDGLHHNGNITEIKMKLTSARHGMSKMQNNQKYVSLETDGGDDK